MLSDRGLERSTRRSNKRTPAALTSISECPIHHTRRFGKSTIPRLLGDFKEVFMDKKDSVEELIRQAKNSRRLVYEIVAAYLGVEPEEVIIMPALKAARKMDEAD